MRVYGGYFLLLILSMFIVSCTQDPKSVLISTNVKLMESNSKIQKAISSLSDEDRQLLISYILHNSLSPDSASLLTIGDAINSELVYRKKLAEELATEQARKEALRKELIQKNFEAVKVMNEALTVSLDRVKFIKSDWQSGIYSDYFQLRLGLKNNTEKNISGVKGVITFRDIFGEEIKSIRLSDDDGVKANSVRTYKGTIPYNQFIDDDKKLRATDISKITFEWAPIIYLFEDGTSMELP